MPKITGCDISILDDFGSFNAFGTQLSTMYSFNSEEIFMFYSFVCPQNNLWNFTKYIFDNIQATSDSFPLFKSECNKPFLDDLGALDGIGTQMKTNWVKVEKKCVYSTTQWTGKKILNRVY